MKLSETGMGYGNTGSFEVAEDGTYTCNLADIQIKAYPSFDDPTVMEDKFVFVYETIGVEDSKGDAFKFFDFIRVVKSLTDNSNLAKRLDQMLGRRLTKDEFGDFDLDDLKDRPWRVTVVDNNGRNKIVSVKPKSAGKAPVVINTPVAPRPKVKPEPVNADGIEDPFE